MLTKYKEFTKADFERMIKEHGGSYSQHPGTDSEIHVIAEDASSIINELYKFNVYGCLVNIFDNNFHDIIIDFRVKNLISQGARDIIHPRWISECINAFKLIPLSPKFVNFFLFVLHFAL
jgi:hypothetical protein